MASSIEREDICVVMHLTLLAVTHLKQYGKIWWKCARMKYAHWEWCPLNSGSLWTYFLRTIRRSYDTIKFIANSRSKFYRRVKHVSHICFHDLFGKVKLSSSAEPNMFQAFLLAALSSHLADGAKTTTRGRPCRQSRCNNHQENSLFYHILNFKNQMAPSSFRVTQLAHPSHENCNA